MSFCFGYLFVWWGRVFLCVFFFFFFGGGFFCFCFILLLFVIVIFSFKMIIIVVSHEHSSKCILLNFIQSRIYTRSLKICLNKHRVLSTVKQTHKCIEKYKYSNGNFAEHSNSYN